MAGPDRPATISELQPAPSREVGRSSAIVLLQSSGKPADAPSALVKLLEAEPELRGRDVLKISYPDPLITFSGARPKYSELPEHFYHDLTDSDEFSRYRRLIVIAHSVGGLIARRAILDHPDLAERVSSLVLLSVPNSGLHIPFLPRSSDSTQFLKLATATIKFASRFGFEPMGLILGIVEWYLGPIKDLLSGSDWILNLNLRWQATFGSSPPFKYWAITGESDRVVGVNALFDVPARNRLVVAGKHVSLIEPSSVEDAGYRSLRSALELQPIPTAAQRAAGALAVAAEKHQSGRFDIILCHASADLQAVHDLGNRLRQAGLNPWITEELQLEGRKWTGVLKEKIDMVGSIAICMGRSKPREKEQADLVALFESKNAPVLPVYLPACSEDESQLAEALHDYVPIDFRNIDSQPFLRLVRTVMGKDPDYLPPGWEKFPELYNPKENTDMEPDNHTPNAGEKTNLWNFFAIAGPAGVALFVLLKVYGKVLEQKIFPTLFPADAFKLLVAALILVAVLTAIAMVILAVQKKAGIFAHGAIALMTIAMLVTVGYTVHAGPTVSDAEDGAIIRGTVVDGKAHTIPHAFVSVTGFPASSTDADGSFHLASHVPAGQEVELHIGAAGFEGKTVTAKAGSSVSITLESESKSQPVPAPAVTAPVKSISPPPPSVQPAKTGDLVIDRVIDNLARLRRSGQMSEADLSQTLAPLFNRREFYGVSAGDWQALLYPLLRTQVLIEQNLENFKSNPLVRDSLTQANRRMAQLEDRVAVLYGPSFRLSDNIRDYGASVGLFKRHLPAVIDAPSAEVLAACDEDIKVVRSLIRKAGFPIQ